MWHLQSPPVIVSSAAGIGINTEFVGSPESFLSPNDSFPSDGKSCFRSSSRAQTPSVRDLLKIRLRTLPRGRSESARLKLFVAESEPNRSYRASNASGVLEFSAAVARRKTDLCRPFITNLIRGIR